MELELELVFLFNKQREFGSNKCRQGSSGRNFCEGLLQVPNLHHLQQQLCIQVPVFLSGLIRGHFAKFFCPLFHTHFLVSVCKLLRMTFLNLCPRFYKYFIKSICLCHYFLKLNCNWIIESKIHSDDLQSISLHRIFDRNPIAVRHSVLRHIVWLEQYLHQSVSRQFNHFHVLVRVLLQKLVRYFNDLFFCMLLCVRLSLLKPIQKPPNFLTNFLYF